MTLKQINLLKLSTWTIFLPKKGFVEIVQLKKQIIRLSINSDNKPNYLLLKRYNFNKMLNTDKRMKNRQNYF